MNKMTWTEAVQYLREFNKKNDITSKGVTEPSCTIAVVFTEDSFEKEYPLESRTYLVNNLNKAFLPNMIGSSIFSNCLDGTDNGVRLDNYIEDWTVDYCYIYFEGKEEDYVSAD